MPVKHDEMKSIIPPPDKDVWPGEWFVLADGEVAGPLSSLEAFSFSETTSSGDPVLVSRTGFSQWYPLSDMSHLYSAAFKVQSEMSDDIAALKRLVTSTRPLQETKFRSSAATLPNIEQTITIGNEVSVDVVAQKALGHLDSLEPDHTARLREAAKKPLPVSEVQEVNAGNLNLLYFLHKDSLKLGMIRPIWSSKAVSGSIDRSSAGWHRWAEALANEIGFHSPGTEIGRIRSEGLPPILSHMVSSFRLANAVQKMELENGYISLNPLVAAFLTLIPSLGRAYIQRSANRHWILHLKAFLNTRNDAGT